MFKSAATRLVLSLFLALPIFLSAQTDPIPCGSDQLHQILRNSIADYAQRVAQGEQAILEKTLNKGEQPEFSGPTYTLPLVFHIIHDGGQENISDARIQAAVDYLNDAFANTGYFGSLGVSADVPFRFCLAYQGQNGMGPGGITRTQSPLTNVLVSSQDALLKNVIQWDPARYINVWVVNSILSEAQGVPYAGYASLPFAHGTSTDGIVIRAAFTGSNLLQENIVLAHEMGHFLGLYHTFEGGCPNGDCLQQGDRVCDTPPDQATFSSCAFNSCDTDADAPAPNPLSTDVSDMTENFMDYSPLDCQYRFTQGQGERMVQMCEELRASLLNSTTCLEPCMEGIFAQFSASATTIDILDTVFFTNTSQNALTYAWFVNGELKSTQPDFFLVPTSIGEYKIRLVVNGISPNCVSSNQKTIHAVCNLTGYIEASTFEVVTGSSLLFRAQVENADTYSWTVNGNPAGQNVLVSWTFVVAGSYVVELRVTNGLCTEVFTVEVQVSDACAAGELPQMWYRAGLLRGVQATTGGGFYLSGDSYLAYIQSDGSVKWAKYMTESNFQHIHLTPEQQLLTYIPAEKTLMLIDTSGNLLWSKQISFGVNNSFDFSASPDGSFLLGVALSSIDSLRWVCFEGDGTERWRINVVKQGYSIITSTSSSEGRFYTSLQNPNEIASTVVCFDENGEIVWSKRYYPIQGYPLFISAIVAESDGGFSFVSEHYLVRCNRQGEVLWAKRFSNPSSAFAATSSAFLKKSKDHGYYCSMAKQFSLFADQYYIKFDSLGEFKWGLRSAGKQIGSFATESTTGLILPLIDPVFQKRLHLLRPDNNGITGGCMDFPFSVTVSSISITTQDLNFVAQPIPNQESVTTSRTFSDVFINSEKSCLELPLCSEDCDNQGIDDDRDGYPDCYDPQCGCLVNPACITKNPPINFQCKIAWESPELNINVSSLPLVANLNVGFDTIPEIVVSQVPPDRRIVLFRGDGANRMNPRKAATAFQIESNTQVAIADLNNDKQPEILALMPGRFTAFHQYFGNSGPNPWVDFQFSFQNQSRYWSSQVADFNEDGVPEIYAGNQILRYDGPADDMLLGIREDLLKPYGQLAHQNGLHKTAQPLAAELLNRFACNNDPDCDGLELGAGPVIYSVDLDFWDGDPPQLNIQRDLNTLDPSPAIWSDGFTAVADIDLDNTPDLVVAGKRDSIYGIYVWNRNGLITFFPYPVNTPFSGAMPCIANVVDDRLLGFTVDYPEIIASSQNRLTCFNLNIADNQPNTPYWWTMAVPDSIGLATPVAYDFNVDGLDEIVFQDEAKLRLMYGGPAPFPPGVDSTRNWYSIPAPTITGTQYPVIADCDGDGAAEIIFTSFDDTNPVVSTNLKGRLRVLEAAHVPWPPARPIWNQYGYNSLNINDDLSVPIHPMQSHLPIGGKRIYNRFLGQAPVLNQQYEPYIPLPNAVVTLDSLVCLQEHFLVFITVCNEGDQDLPSDIPLRFYDANPTISNAQPLGDLQFLNQSKVAPGQCVSPLLVIPAIKGQTIYGVLNDNDLNTTPFNLSQGFKPGKSYECSFTDNIFSIYKDWTTPVLDLGPDLSSCSANAVTLQAANTFARYQWQDGSIEAQYTAAGPGKYWLDAWDECGFKQSDTVVIQLSALGQLNLGTVPPICLGDTLTFSVAGFETVRWSPAQLVSCDTCPNIQIAPQTSVLLVATGIEDNCIASDSLTIQVRQVPQITHTASTPSQQTMSNGSAWLELMGGLPPYQIVWNTVPPQMGDSITQLPAGLYSFVVTDAAGCQTTGSVPVEQVVATDAPAPIPFTLRPNPAGKQFWLEWPVEATSILIFNALGEQIMAKDLTPNEQHWEVDCANWPAGTYDVVLKTKGETWSRKVVVLR